MSAPEQTFPFSFELLSRMRESREFHSSNVATKVVDEIMGLIKTASVAALSFDFKPGEDEDERGKNTERSERMGQVVEETIGKLDHLYRQSLDLQTEHNLILTSLDTAIAQNKDEFNAMLEGLDCSNYEERKTVLISDKASELRNDLYQQYLSEPESQRYGTNSSYLNYRQQLWNLQRKDEDDPLNLNKLFSDYNEDDEDLIEEHTRESFKCPLTKRFFEDPVTSSVCNHSFSKSAIMNVIHTVCADRREPQSTVVVKCPVPACAKYFGVKHLKSNPELAKRAKRDQDREIRETQAQNATLQRL